MAGFSMGEAIGSGFGLIRREPKTILIWIAAYAALVVVQYGLMWSIMPDMLGYYQAMGRGLTSGGGGAGDAEALALASRMMAFAPIMFLVGLVILAVMQGAIFRAVLHPEDRRFAYLRFGRSELWLLLTTLVLWILIAVIYFVLALVVGLVGGLIGAAVGGGGDTAAVAGVVVLAILACLVLTLIIALRLSLALPMSHDQARFVVFAGWSLTKGQSLKLLLVGIALVLIVILLEVLVFALLGVVLLLASGLGTLEAAFAAPTPELAGRLLPWTPLIALLFAALGVVMYTIMIAPLADIYRQLTAGAALSEAA